MPFKFDPVGYVKRVTSSFKEDVDALMEGDPTRILQNVVVPGIAAAVMPEAAACHAVHEAVKTSFK